MRWTGSLFEDCPNAVVAIAAIWLMVQFRKELALNRTEMSTFLDTFLLEVRKDREDFIAAARTNGEAIARIEERTRQLPCTINQKH